MKILKPVVAALALNICVTLPAVAQQDDLDDLFAALKSADVEASEPIARKIWEEWSKSGSPAMDLLLERGRKMMEQGDLVLAIEHYSALIDHAPDFAEGYNARATALFQLNRYGESLADIRMALALNPRHFGALGGLATLLEEMGYEVEALAAWRAVHDLYPAQPGAKAAIQRLTVIAEGVET
ncbi:tetratricopeptide repeat protein [Oceaniglobus trochenteri]|uniref:tetratricopeptide repeat protein n=1 Tax=Oceaniglobus trochenteri TaxID=2763260 RepID=UPI001CFFEDE8|nr:tetratricopeptide repeat protein [Oceaniglobus trochenteri]